MAGAGLGSRPCALHTEPGTGCHGGGGHDVDPARPRGRSPSRRCQPSRRVLPPRGSAPDRPPAGAGLLRPWPELPSDAERPLGHPRWQRGVLDQLGDGGVRAHDCVVAFDHHTGTGDPAAQAFLHVEVPAGQLQATEEGADLAEVGACVEECSPRLGESAMPSAKQVEPGEGLWAPVSAAAAGRSRRRRRSRCRCPRP